MPLKLVRIQDFRCVALAELDLAERRNYIYGPNGAGKTSLLEAVYLLGRGRSFRSRQNRRLIRHGGDCLSVYGEVHGADGSHRLGVRLNGGGLETRVDGAGDGGVAELARKLPVNVIEPSIHQLIEGGPSMRRRFLDWGVFHVEPSFLESWRRYRRVLGQRNAALKLGQSTSSWDQNLLAAGEAVDSARRRYCAELNGAVTKLGAGLVGQEIELGYRRGWPEGLELSEALVQSYDRDRQLGATQAGPHRADLRIAMASRAVREEASRGQQKLVAAAMILAQTEVFAAIHGDAGTLLVDDPAAELDAQAFRRLMAALSESPVQLIMTGLSEQAFPPLAGFPVFHVEQGRVSTVV